jgi:hypothetical protein
MRLQNTEMGRIEHAAGRRQEIIGALHALM